MGTYYLSVLSRIEGTVSIRGERMELSSELGGRLWNLRGEICAGEEILRGIPAHISML